MLKAQARMQKYVHVVENKKKTIVAQGGKAISDGTKALKIVMLSVARI